MFVIVLICDEGKILCTVRVMLGSLLSILSAFPSVTLVLEMCIRDLYSLLKYLTIYSLRQLNI